MGESDEEAEARKTIVLAQRETQDQRFLTSFLSSIGDYEVVGSMRPPALSARFCTVPI